MSRWPIVWIALHISFMPCQGQLFDDFSDGELLTQPAWQGDLQFFKVEQEQLRSDGPAENATLQLVTGQSLAQNVVWEWWLHMDFNPSGSNYARIYLLADRPDLNDPDLQGYYIHIGESGSDDSMDLYRQEGGLHTRIIDGAHGLAAIAPTLRIQVIRDASGSWTIACDTEGGHDFNTLVGETGDVTSFETAFFGFLCRHTSTRRDKFFFDDVSIRPWEIDENPPSLDSLQVLSSRQVLLYFNEPLDITSLHEGSLYLESTTHRIEAFQLPQPNQIQLEIAPALGNGVIYTLHLDGIRDQSGNAMPPMQKDIQYIAPYIPSFGDVVFSEIMADPVPPRGLPASEYVELFNTTDTLIQLRGWTWNGKLLPEIELPPKRYLVLFEDLVNSPEQYGIAAIPEAWPGLPNAGDELELRSPNGDLIDFVAYIPHWHRDALARDGGWSLEIIDPYRRCGEGDNWITSTEASGGTPGRQNSIFARRPDLITPHLEAAYLIKPHGIWMIWNEVIPLEQFRSASPVLQPLMNLIPSDELFARSFFLFGQDFPEGEFPMVVEGVRDCAGNIGSRVEQAIPHTEPADSGDIRLNEILFNPFPGGYDFVELKNTSSKYINLNGWQLANGSNSELPERLEQISSMPLVLDPGSYMAFSEDPGRVFSDYPKASGESIFRMENLPAYPDKEGHVFLIGQPFQIVDQLSYHEDQHFPLLKDVEGVSLERLENTQHWVSAASTSGYATPGYRNSHREQVDSLQEIITVLPRIISPNWDGRDDFAEITLTTSFSQGLGTLRIFDLHGRPIRTLLSQKHISQHDILIWDGTDDAGNRLRSGHYLLLFEWVGVDGRVLRQKETIVVTASR